MNMERVETERLILRMWTLEDAQDMYDYARSEKVGPAAGWKPHENMEESRRIIKERFLKAGDVWATQRKDDGRCIGSIGLHMDPSRPGELPVRMLGYVMNERDWGKGFMHEGCRAALRYAFDKMGLELVTVSHYPFNDRSRRVIEGLGFHREGLRRMAGRRYDGQIMDEVAYSMTAEEFGAWERQAAIHAKEKRENVE